MLRLKFLLILLYSCGLQWCIGQTVKVMSYNIHHGADREETDRLHEMGSFIKNSGADIIALQEVDSVCTRTKGVDQMKILAAITGMHYAFVRHYAYQGGAYGMGILSRYPILNIRNKRLTLLKGTKSSSTAMIVADIVISKSKKVIMASAHFALDDSSRWVQAQEVVDYLRQEKMPVIFVGDLNAKPEAPEINYLKKYFVDTDTGNVFTFPAPHAERKIDYIFVKKSNLKRVKNYRVFINDLSDHLPVMADISLK